MCVTHDTGELLPPRSTELLDLLRQIADHGDFPDSVQADARDYLRYLEATSSGSGSLTSEARSTPAATSALQHDPEVVYMAPRPRSESS
jgi:hypothetical protein